MKDIRPEHRKLYLRVMTASFLFGRAAINAASKRYHIILLQLPSQQSIADSVLWCGLKRAAVHVLAPRSVFLMFELAACHPLGCFPF